MQSTEPETWKPVAGWEDLYEVSDHGRVRSFDRIVTYSNGRVVRHAGRILRPASHRQGYLYVQLNEQGRKQVGRIHRLVAIAFLGDHPGLDVCHNDSNPENNRLTNLRWDTVSGNMLDAVALGRNPSAKKTHCPRQHLLAMPNLRRHEWETKGTRHCYSCNRERDRARRLGVPFNTTAADEVYRIVMSRT